MENSSRGTLVYTLAGAFVGFIHGAFLLVRAIPVLPYIHPRMVSERHGFTLVALYVHVHVRFVAVSDACRNKFRFQRVPSINRIGVANKVSCYCRVSERLQAFS
jgi:hypothetical protein